MYTTIIYYIKTYIGHLRRNSMEVKVMPDVATELKRLMKEKNNPNIGARIYISGHA
jgi:hypothetical protein